MIKKILIIVLLFCSSCFGADKTIQSYDTANQAESDWILISDTSDSGRYKKSSATHITADYGENELLNSTFDSDASNWTLDADWVWSSGKLYHQTPGTSGSILGTGSSSIVPGKMYKITFDISGSTAGGIIPKIGASISSVVSGNGSHIIFITALYANTFSIDAYGGFDGYLDNIAYQPIGDEGDFDIDKDLRVGRSITIGPGNKAYPALKFQDNTAIGFYSYDGGWNFAKDGHDLIRFGEEDSTAAIITGLASNRFTIDSISALVLRSQVGHIELEGSASATFVEVIGYRAGTYLGVPILFKTDPLLPSNPTMGVKRVTGQTGTLFSVKDTNDSDLFSVDIYGVVTAGGGSANKAVCYKSDGKTQGYCSSAVDSSGGCTCN